MGRFFDQRLWNHKQPIQLWDCGAAVVAFLPSCVEWSVYFNHVWQWFNQESSSQLGPIIESGMSLIGRLGFQPHDDDYFSITERISHQRCACQPAKAPASPVEKMQAADGNDDPNKGGSSCVAQTPPILHANCPRRPIISLKIPDHSFAVGGIWLRLGCTLESSHDEQAF